MSTDYRIEIRRKADKKLLGIVDANCLKTILDAGLQDCLHIDGWSSDSKEFSYDDVCRCEDEANKKIDGCWA